MEDSNSDDDVVVNKHTTLLKNAAAAYGKKFQRIQPSGRKESSFEVSEFHLYDKRKKKEKLAKTLAGSLDKIGKHANLSQKVKKVQTYSKPLPAPLERPEAEKIKRAVAFDNAKNLLTRWEPIVNTNKVTEELHFPLNTPYFRMTSTKNFLANLKPKTELELEVDKILSGISDDTKEQEDNTPKKTFFLNRKEIIEQRKELSRIRAQQSFREAKARRQNKIKSKKYHRILRREKIRKQIQEFEKLQKTDPEAALKKLEELEKTRAEERVSLRHRSSGQWARNKAVHAKYDKECRQQLEQQLRLSRDLTQKVNLANSSDDEDVEDNQQLPFEDNNPWMKSEKNEYEEFSNKYRKFWDEQNLSKDRAKDISGETDSLHKLKKSESSQLFSNDDCAELDKSKESKSNCGTNVKYGFLVTDINKSVKGILKCKRNAKVLKNGWKCSKIEDLKEKSVEPSKAIDVDDMFEDMEKLLKNKFEKKVSHMKRESNKEKKPKKKKKNDKGSGKSKDCGIGMKDELALQITINEETNRDPLRKGVTDGNSDITTQIIGKLGKRGAVLSSSVKTSPLEINPNNFITISEKKLGSTQVPDIIADYEDDADEATKGNLMTISEAFLDDDVVAEFRQEKEATAEKDRPKDIDLTLPGWGEWAGKGLPQISRKKKRFIIPAPKAIPRKDDKKDSVIINEDADIKARKHQVSELPYPYVAVESFESNIRAPLGSTWVPETAHRKLIAPRVATLMGTVIEPLSEEALVDHSEVKKALDENEDVI